MNPSKVCAIHYSACTSTECWHSSSFLHSLMYLFANFSFAARSLIRNVNFSKMFICLLLELIGLHEIVASSSISSFTVSVICVLVCKPNPSCRCFICSLINCFASYVTQVVALISNHVLACIASLLHCIIWPVGTDTATNVFIFVGCVAQLSGSFYVCVNDLYYGCAR